MYLVINLGGRLSNRSNHGGLAGAKVEGAGVKMCHLADAHDAQRHDGVDHQSARCRYALVKDAGVTAGSGARCRGP
jgi:hypothetical protein